MIIWNLSRQPYAHRSEQPIEFYILKHDGVIWPFLSDVSSDEKCWDQSRVLILLHVVTPIMLLDHNKIIGSSGVYM